MAPAAYIPMEPTPDGYWQAVASVDDGARYFYRLNGVSDRPDPASRFQPEGVHGPSQIVGDDFAWEDQAWNGLPIEAYVLYELHVGTFTPEGTFDAVIPYLPYLKALGITVLELMPVAQFPGRRNWGYDGVYPYAVQNSYGGPAGLKRLVNACHVAGLGVCVDVVYNHLGPEGNYLADFGPYFTDRYQTPWGSAVNFDGAQSDEVRLFFIENALHWIRDFHVDALRLDAVHAIFDQSAYTFLEELGDAAHREGKRLGRIIQVIPESDLNDPRLVRPKDRGGFGHDAQWNDGFHHALRTLITKDRSGYYQDYGQVRHLVKAYEEGFVYSGEYSTFRRRCHGASSRDITAERMVVFSQNHDQVGNRMLGERLSVLASFEDLKLAAAAVLLSPFLPLLFMGEEYGETAPFLYFVEHSDPGLIEGVRLGRKREFAESVWQGEPPDPQARETFLRSTLNHRLRESPPGRTLLAYYQELLRLRKEIPALRLLSKKNLQVLGFEQERSLFFRRWCGEDEVFALVGMADEAATLELPVPVGRWKRLLDSADHAWLGAGTTRPDTVESTGALQLAIGPKEVVLYRREGKV